MVFLITKHLRSNPTIRISNNSCTGENSLESYRKRGRFPRRELDDPNEDIIRGADGVNLGMSTR